MKTSDLFMGTGFALMIIIYIIQNYLIMRLLNELKTRFPGLWEQLGRPSLIMNNSLSNMAALTSFLWRKRYLDLNDVDFSERCATARMSSIFSLIFAMVW